jgi:hypothetical protein
LRNGGSGNASHQILGRAKRLLQLVIKTRTVFVLGAGASFPYGFPLGAGLRQELVQYFSSPETYEPWNVLTRKSAFTPEQISGFARSFSRSNMASIDAFLAKRGEFADVGKAAIATLLCAKEEEAHLFADGAKDHWYRLLWNALMADTTQLADVARNSVRFVTFNYDRSLEHFLHQSIKHSWGVADVHALTILKDIRLLHVYGSLGPYHFEQQHGYRTYGEPVNAGGLGLAASSIHVIPEVRKDEAFVETRKWFDWAERICFLGFGFDRLNMERLDLQSVQAAKRASGNPLPEIFATVLGRTVAEQNEDSRRLLGEHATLNRIPGDCSDLLRSTNVLFG